jgi:hypothetical protein
MSELESSIFWRPKTTEPLDKRIYDFAEVLLMVKELEYLNTTQSGRLPERIASLREHVLSNVENRNEIGGSTKSIPERVKAARKTIMEKRLAEDQPAEQLQQLHHDMEDLFLVVQSFSYPGDYVDDHPSTDRMAETIDKFEEDVLQKTTATIKAERRVQVTFGEPVDVSSDRKVKSQTTTITATIEQRVQEMLDMAK